MAASDASGPTVSLSFANNFWGKDDAGVGPLIERMHGAKTTCDELKNFYSVRAAIEEEYAKKLLNLARKPFGSCESGTLKASMDVLRSEVEGSGKAHQKIAGQMKTELEEPLASFSGAMRERRKLVQNTIEKLLKLKISQTQTVNKTRDRYEQDCLRIKGYLAQGHMVMGQEEKKNKAKLEKTQIALASSNAEYETAIKALEETTTRWNKEWQQACDTFQDLDEERIDFLKTSLWTFANIASTVCVSDDAAYEKVRLSLENCEVEKDITSFIRDRGTGQEIPDAPKYINFCRGDLSDDGHSEAADDNYRVAQFARSGNPTYRSSSPNPSMLSRATDVTEMEDERPRRKMVEADAMSNRESTPRSLRGRDQVSSSPARPPSSHAEESEYSSATSLSGGSDMQRTQKGSSPPATHPLQAEDKVEKKKGFFSNSPFRRKSKSEKQHQQQLVQQQQKPSQQSQYQQYQQIQQTPKHTTPMKPPSLTSRRTWGAEPSQQFITDAPNNRNPARNSQSMAMGLRNSPEPIDPRASFQLNVGENVFDVAPPDGMRQQNPQQQQQAQRQEEEDPTLDPIAQALATLKGVAGNASVRKSADRYYGISTPAPQATPGVGNDVALAAKRGTPPPSYMTPKRSALDLPAPAFTSAQMQQSTQKYRQQTEHMLEGPPQMPAALQEAGSMGRSGSGQSNRERANTIDYHRSPSRQTTRDGNGPNGQELVRAASPNPSTMRSVSPRPQIHGDPHRFSTSPRPSIDYNRGPSPNPSYQAQSRPGTANMQSRNSGQGEYFQNPAQPPYQNQQARNSPSPHPMTGQELSQYRPYSPNPQALVQAQQQQQQRPRSQHGGSFNMDAHSGAVESFGRSRGRNSYYGGEDHGGGYVNGNQQLAQRPRSKSVVDIHRAQLSRDGRVILHYARAIYLYQAAIPEELSFQKGDILAVLRIQPDGWWEAELVGGLGGAGLVPSNYMQVQ